MRIFPLLKTDGLADVLGALPQAQAAVVAYVRLLIPGFSEVTHHIHTKSEIVKLNIFGEKVVVHYGVYNRYGQITYLKAGSYYADKVLFVSPTCTNEVNTPMYSCRLENLLKQHQLQSKLCEVLNDIDYNIWDRLKDTGILENYDLRKIREKAKYKAMHQGQAGLTVTDKISLLAIISRQKGLHLLLEALPTLLKLGRQLTLLDIGEQNLIDAYLTLEKKYHKQVSMKINYNASLAHKIMTAENIILISSRFEPCGLTELYDLKYSILSLVRYTGRLTDKVSNCSLENLSDKTVTGFIFKNNQINYLNNTIHRVFALGSGPVKSKKFNAKR